MQARWLIVVAAGGVLLLTLIGRWAARPEVPAAPPGEETAQTIGAARSARVEERLTRLRQQWTDRERAAAPSQPDVTRPDASAATSAAPPEAVAAARRTREAWGVGRREEPPTVPAPSTDAPDRAKLERLRGVSLRWHPAYMSEHTDLGAIESTILDGKDPQRRREALQQVAGEDENDAVRILTNALAMEQSDPEFRVALVEALDDYADYVGPEVLDGPLHDPLPAVRFEAVSMLGDMNGSPAVTAALRSAANDADPEVRELARGILEIPD